MSISAQQTLKKSACRQLDWRQLALTGIAAISLTIAAVLLLASLVVHSPPSSSMRDSAGLTYRVAPQLEGWHDERLLRRRGEFIGGYAWRANLEVFRATYHCNYQQTGHSLAAYAIARWRPEQLPSIRQSGYLHPRILQCGFCHQRAFILASALRRNGAENAHVLGVNGHVVAAYDYNGDTYIVDPDYGVGPFKLDRSPEGAAIRERQVAEAYAPVFEAEPNLRALLIGAFLDISDDEEYSTLNALELEAEQQIYQGPDDRRRICRRLLLLGTLGQTRNDRPDARG